MGSLLRSKPARPASPSRPSQPPVLGCEGPRKAAEHADENVAPRAGQLGKERVQGNPMPSRKAVKRLQITEPGGTPLGLAVTAEHLTTARIVRDHLSDRHLRADRRTPP